MTAVEAIQMQFDQYKAIKANSVSELEDLYLINAAKGEELTRTQERVDKETGKLKAELYDKDKRLEMQTRLRLDFEMRINEINNENCKLTTRNIIFEK